MPSRNFQDTDYERYRYSFNGKEDDEDFQDYGMRGYLKKVGRFLSVDPIGKAYPFYSPYQYAGNMPIMATDLDGLEPQVDVIQKIKYKPVLDAKSFKEVVSNSLHNIVAVPANVLGDVFWNGPATLVNHSINLAYGKYNDVNGSVLLMQLNSEFGRQTDGLLKMTPIQHLEAFKDAATNLQNYEVAGGLITSYYLMTPKVQINNNTKNISKLAIPTSQLDRQTLMQCASEGADCGPTAVAVAKSIREGKVIKASQGEVYNIGKMRMELNISENAFIGQFENWKALWNSMESYKEGSHFLIRGNLRPEYQYLAEKGSGGHFFNARIVKGGKVEVIDASNTGVSNHIQAHELFDSFIIYKVDGTKR